MNNYEQKIGRRKQRYLELAKRFEERSKQYYEEYRKNLEMIPPGQPILVGHHSEKGHRKHLEKIDNLMEKSIKFEEKAKYYKEKAKNIGSSGISSDDPEVITKLKKELEETEESLENAKKYNKLYKKWLKGEEVKIPEYILKEYERVKKWGYGNPFYTANISAKIRRIKKRIEHLEKIKQMDNQVLENDKLKIVINTDENRVQLFFDSKDTAMSVKPLLKRGGWRWSRNNMCWQLNISNQAIYKAKTILKELEN